MSIALWLLAPLLALAFLAAGSMKLIKTRTALIEDPRMGWATDFSPSQIRVIGLVEVLGALSLLVATFLTRSPAVGILSAATLAALMLGGVVTHFKRGESVVPAAVLATLCLGLVAIIRHLQ